MMQNVGDFTRIFHEFPPSSEVANQFIAVVQHTVSCAHPSDDVVLIKSEQCVSHWRESFSASYVESNMSEVGEFSDVIGLIYESVQVPETWPTALTAASRFLSIKDIGLVSYDIDSHQFEAISTPLDPSYVRSYEEYWGCRNFLWKSSVVLPVGVLFSFETAISSDQFARTGLYNEWFHPQGMDKALGANILVDGSLSAAVTVYRPSSGPDFTERDATRFRALLPHLQRAWQLRSRLQAGGYAGDDVRAVVAAIEKPAILVDREANFLCANGAGSAIIRDRGLILDRKGRLSTSKPEETGSLQKLIHTAATQKSASAGGKMIARRENKTSLVLLVSPLPGARFAGKDQIAIVFIDDAERDKCTPPNIDLLRSQFQLTHAEAALASLILRGDNLHQAAAKSDVAVSTARTHLSRIFQKTDTHSQSALLRLLGKAGYHD
ncbi:hypothetical protein QEV83_02645 [Methylocapsa sp. D3K7]|uniref:helix-turn-helix transcriptional regulator n=1 Tax=Methylocapsa sp. D3K7 TaxID=3041435 RepID=UPI00244E6CEF|nr:hypothetical protein [Methylocapsa sp. D3K7]WGJ15218.1 hypothetical protein QEV83_02645 [Methylocapsa sp. D3K7]